MTDKRQLRRILGLILALALIGAACSDDDSAAPAVDNADGFTMVSTFIETIAAGDMEAIEDLLSDGYQNQHGNGTGDTKDEYIEAPSELRRWEIGGETVTTQHGDYAVVRWTMAIDSTIGGVEFGQDTNPRLTTFVWEDDRWRVISHANFNAP